MNGFATVEITLPERGALGDAHVCCLANNDVMPLDTRPAFRADVVGLTARHPEGMRVLRRSMCFLLAMAVRRVAPEAPFKIMHSAGDGFYFETDAPFEDEMRAVVARDLPIDTTVCAYDEAVELFKSSGQSDKLGLLEHINTPVVCLQRCADFTELAQGPLVPRTGMLGVFEIIPEGGGFIMQLPSESDPSAVAGYRPRHALMREHREHAEWGRRVGLETVADLNAAAQSSGIGETIQLCEALHARNFAKIADGIAARSPVPKLVLLAGPSSAGKTTSAKRLGVNLRNNGFRHLMLSADDYYAGEGKYPLDEDGKPDYEHIEALDLENFNADLETLLAGRAIKKRVFDFKTKKPVWNGAELALADNGILIVEGIHGLNPALTPSVPREAKHLVFLSALTQLGIDSNNVLSTSDNRLVRRLVRDHLYRGSSALRTLGMWGSVRRGEERWIFPFQENADVSFNTALDYELAVLRPYAEPLLAEVKPKNAEYATARRLGKVLGNFHAITAEKVPADSLLREYIGGSVFDY